MFDVDKFVSEIENKYKVRLDHDKCKLTYIDGCITEYIFIMEQQGKEVSKEEIEQLETSLKERLGYNQT